MPYTVTLRVVSAVTSSPVNERTVAEQDVAEDNSSEPHIVEDTASEVCVFNGVIEDVVADEVVRLNSCFSTVALRLEFP